MTSLERTLVVLKPDAVARSLAGRLIQRFEDAGLKIVGLRMARLDDEMVRKHYFDLEERFGAAVFQANAEAMQRGPVIAMVLEGVDAAKNVRRLVGGTFPNEDPPGTIRGDFAHQSKAYAESQSKAVANLVHASGNAEEAKYEVELWFGGEGDQFDYRLPAEAYIF